MRWQCSGNTPAIFMGLHDYRFDRLGWRGKPLELVMVTAPAQPIAFPTATEVITLDILGMKCAGCVRAVEQRLQQIPGVQQATVNLVTEVATVEVAIDAAITPAMLAQAITDAGFPSQPRQAIGFQAQLQTGLANLETLRAQHNQHQRQDLITAIVLLIASSLGHATQMLGWSIPALTNDWFHGSLAAATLLVPGRGILVDGWQGLRRNAPNMNTLIGMGALTAFVTSAIALLWPQLGWECFFSEPVMLIGFILLGRALEGRARSRAASALQALAALRPATANVVGKDKAGVDATAAIANSTIALPLDLVQVGDWVQVLPGEQIPIDGQILQGTTTIDEAMLTGESIPVTKQVGDPVAGGTMNQSGAIVLRVSTVGQNTTLARIIKLVEEAQSRKAPIQLLADTVAGYFTYGVLTLALLTFGFWYFLGSYWWPELAIAHPMAHHAMGGMHREALPSVMATPLLLSIKLTIAVLVIACPCALGLATPMALLVGTGIGAERGLLIRGGDVLEKAHQLTTVVFDKTGTLTQGQPVVMDCLPTQGLSPAQLMRLAATVEQGTQHPLAQAILQAAQAQDLSPFPATDYRTIAGAGISALVDGNALAGLGLVGAVPAIVRLGTLDWLQSQGVTDTDQARAQTLAAAGKTVVGISAESRFLGLIAIADAPRPEAAAVIQQLQQQGLRVMMLTGDRSTTALALAAKLGLPADCVLAEVKPAEKATTIAHLQHHRNGAIAMVGDGINDAPALAQADVGIALQSGTEVATETADILLMRNSLRDIPTVLGLSRATFRRIRQNLFWAFAYNIIALPIAAGVLLPQYHLTLSPSNAGLLMILSSLTVVTNSLRLRWQWR
jgi:P-type Cu2+ transporter